MQFKICPTCGHRNLFNVLVCVNCGSVFTSGFKREIVTEAEPKRPAKKTTSHLTNVYTNSLLLFIGGQEKPLVVPGRQKRVVLGRASSDAPPVDVDLTSYGGAALGVSRTHAIITFNSKGYALQDLESTNGTWINQVRLPAHEAHQLRSSDRITLGQLQIYVYFNLPEDVEQVLLLRATDPLTMSPQDLVSRITPYVNTLTTLQDVVLRFREVEDSPRGQINAIMANKTHQAVMVNVENLNEAVSLVQQVLQPWRDHQKSGQHEPVKAEELLKQEMLNKIDGTLLDWDLQEQLTHRLMAIVHNLLESEITISKP